MKKCQPLAAVMTCAAVLALTGCTYLGSFSQDPSRARFLDAFCSVERDRAHLQGELLFSDTSIAESTSVHILLESVESAAATFEDVSLDWPTSVDRKDLLAMAEQYRFEADGLRALAQGHDAQEGFGEPFPKTYVAFDRLSSALGIDDAYAKCGIE